MLNFNAVLGLVIWIISIDFALGQCEHIKLQKTQFATYEIPVKINGSKITSLTAFLFDTGCSRTLIGHDLFENITKIGGLDNAFSSRTITTEDANGVKKDLKLFRLKSITIGNRTIIGVEVVVSDSNVSNLLGQNVISLFGQYIFDKSVPELIIGQCIEESKLVNITLLLNSKYSDGQIFIDGFPAQLVKNYLTFKTIWVEKDKQHYGKIVEKNGETSCEFIIPATSDNQSKPIPVCN